MKHLVIISLIFSFFFSYSQEQGYSDWKEHEIKKYKTLKALATYTHNKKHMTYLKIHYLKNISTSTMFWKTL